MMIKMVIISIYLFIYLFSLILIVYIFTTITLIAVVTIVYIITIPSKQTHRHVHRQFHKVWKNTTVPVFNVFVIFCV